jgi:hypothetical protein
LLISKHLTARWPTTQPGRRERRQRAGKTTRRAERFVGNPRSCAPEREPGPAVNPRSCAPEREPGPAVNPRSCAPECEPGPAVNRAAPRPKIRDGGRRGQERPRRCPKVPNTMSHHGALIPYPWVSSSKW